MNVISRGARVLRATMLGLALLLGVTACDKREANEYAAPEAAAHAMFQAFARVQSDPESAWSFLGPDTRARLEALAAQGPEHLRPTDYLRFGWLPDEALVLSVERQDQGGRTARLSVVTELGDSFEIEMLRAERGWQVELGQVMAPPITPASEGDAP